MRLLLLLLFLSLLPWCCSAFQMVEPQHDTTYYVSYNKYITSRFYFSRKFTTVAFKNSEKHYDLNYLPNTTLNMGIGATYKWATLNLAYGFGFLNPERGRGNTKYLDLQFHSYGRKIVIDAFGQFYKGFYLSQKQYAPPEKTYYLRPDLRVNLVGASGQYVFNHRQLSYRASFLQNEWQKKSAGSLLVGLEFYVGYMNADSSILPAPISKISDQLQLKQLNFFEFGPNVGYAHTFVIKQHFFITGSASISLDYGRSVQKSDSQNDKVSGFSPNAFVRFFGGYNSEKWGISLVYVRDRIRLSSSGSNTQILFDIGNFRLNYIYRFFPGKKTRKVLAPVRTADEITK